eukprot:988473-Amphidinium_carterae.1
MRFKQANKKATGLEVEQFTRAFSFFVSRVDLGLPKQELVGWAVRSCTRRYSHGNAEDLGLQMDYIETLAEDQWSQ